jgi:alpha-L-fucosidase
VQTEEQDELGEHKFLPGECDCRMRLENWFYSDSDEDTVKSVDERMGLYMYSVGRGANLLLNIGPDRRGLLPQKDKDVLRKFGQKVKDTFANLVDVDSEREGNVTTLKFDLQMVNMVVIEEEIDEIEIENFEIKVYPYSYGQPITVYKGETIGHKAICQFPSVRTNRIEIVCDKNKKINAKIKYVPVY